MKRTIFLFIFLIWLSVDCDLFSQEKSGYKTHVVQWYENIKSISLKYSVPEQVLLDVNCLKGPTLKTRQVLLIPISEKYWTLFPEQENEEKRDSTAVGKTTIGSVIAVADTCLVPQRTHKISMGLVLPFHDVKEAVNKNSIDFYCGALLAIKQAGEEGLDIVLNVNDFSKEVDSVQLSSSNFIIGPIRSSDIEKTISIIGEDKLTVSPLDSKADSLTSRHPNLVQAAVSSCRQWNGLIDFKTGSDLPEKWIVVHYGPDKSAMEEVKAVLSGAGISYTGVECGVTGDLVGWEGIYNELCTFNVVIAINNEAALNNAVRNMSIFVPKGNVNVLCNSKIRSYNSIPAENIHKAEVHALCTYYVDYRDEKTRNFLHKYRALFNSEPSQFAFQGYDLTMFMLKTYSKYGPAWKHCIVEDKECRMLQNCFKFSKTPEGSLVNEGVLQVVYGKDWSVKSVEIQ